MTSNKNKVYLKFVSHQELKEIYDFLIKNGEKIEDISESNIASLVYYKHNQISFYPSMDQWVIGGGYVLKGKIPISLEQLDEILKSLQTDPLTWFANRISHGGLVSKKEFNKLLEEAKQKQKEHLSNASLHGFERATNKETLYTDDYYNITFKK